MLSIILGILTFVLILVSLFLVLVVLSQKAKSDGGIGAAMGGGMAEAAFGAETSNILSKMTIYASILFFSLSLTLYLGRLHQHKHGAGAGANALPNIPAETGPLNLNLPLTPASDPTAVPAGETPGSSTTPAAAPATTPPAVPAAPAPAQP